MPAPIEANRGRRQVLLGDRARVAAARGDAGQRRSGGRGPEALKPVTRSVTKTWWDASARPATNEISAATRRLQIGKEEAKEDRSHGPGRATSRR